MMMRNKDLGFFEALGFQYYGPIDGHDLKSLEETLRQVKNAERSLRDSRDDKKRVWL